MLGRKVQERGDICMHIANSLPCTAETNKIVKQLYSNLKKKNTVVIVIGKYEGHEAGRAKRLLLKTHEITGQETNCKLNSQLKFGALKNYFLIISFHCRMKRLIYSKKEKKNNKCILNWN